MIALENQLSLFLTLCWLRPQKQKQKTMSARKFANCVEPSACFLLESLLTTFISLCAATNAIRGAAWCKITSFSTECSPNVENICDHYFLETVACFNSPGIATKSIPSYNAQHCSLKYTHSEHFGNRCNATKHNM